MFSSDCLLAPTYSTGWLPQAASARPPAHPPISILNVPVAGDSLTEALWYLFDDRACHPLALVLPSSLPAQVRKAPRSCLRAQTGKLRDFTQTLERDQLPRCLVSSRATMVYLCVSRGCSGPGIENVSISHSILRPRKEELEIEVRELQMRMMTRDFSREGEGRALWIYLQDSSHWSSKLKGIIMQYPRPREWSDMFKVKTN